MVNHPLFADVFHGLAFFIPLGLIDSLDEAWEVVVFDFSITVSFVSAVIEGSELIVHAALKEVDTKGGLKDEDEGSGSIGTAPAVAVNSLIWGSVLEDLDGFLEISGADAIPEGSE